MARPTEPTEVHSASRAIRLRAVLITVAVWAGLVSIFILQRMVGGLVGGRTIPWLPGMTLEVAYWIPWLALAPVLIHLARRYPLTPEAWRRNVPVHLVTGLIVGIVQSAGSVILEQLAIPLFDLVGPPGARRLSSWPTFAVYVVTALWKYWAFLGVFNAFLATRRARERELLNAQLESQLTAARLQTLQSRLTPHFLFNALHSASMLALTEPERTSTVLTQLADLLRDALRDTPEREIPLSRELEISDRYLALEEVRFADRLRVEREIASTALPALVPPFLLQPLIENAIRHGISAASTAGTLRVEARPDGEMLTIVISDDGPGLPPGWRLETQPGLGLSITAARLELLYHEGGTMSVTSPSAGGCRVELRFPLRFS